VHRTPVFTIAPLLLHVWEVSMQGGRRHNVSHRLIAVQVLHAAARNAKDTLVTVGEHSTA
jgi:hypothetical protein